MKGRSVRLTRDILVGSFVYGLEEMDSDPESDGRSHGGVVYLAGLEGEIISPSSHRKGLVMVAFKTSDERAGRVIHVRLESIADFAADPVCTQCGRPLPTLEAARLECPSPPPQYARYIERRLVDPDFAKAHAPVGHTMTIADDLVLIAREQATKRAKGETL